MLHQDVVQGSGELHVRSSEPDGKVHDGGWIGCFGSSHEGSCVLFEHANWARVNTECEHVPLHMDNTATLHVIGNRAFSSRTTYIALRFFYIRELVKENKVTSHYISTSERNVWTWIVFNNFHRWSRASNFIDVIVGVLCSFDYFCVIQVSV